VADRILAVVGHSRPVADRIPEAVGRRNQAAVEQHCIRAAAAWVQSHIPEACQVVDQPGVVHFEPALPGLLPPYHTWRKSDPPRSNRNLGNMP